MNVFEKTVRLEDKRTASMAAKGLAAYQLLEDMRLGELAQLAQEAQTFIPSCTHDVIDRGSPFEKEVDVVPDNPAVWLTLRFFDEDQDKVKALLKKSDYIAEGSYKLDDRRIHLPGETYRKRVPFFVRVWKITVPGNGNGLGRYDHEVKLEFYQQAETDEKIGENCKIVTVKRGVVGHEQSAILCEEEVAVPVS